MTSGYGDVTGSRISTVNGDLEAPYRVLGKDPQSGVAQPTGELDQTRGVWIGDCSAFPRALGVNVMVTCTALATRTAEFIA